MCLYTSILRFNSLVQFITSKFNSDVFLEWTVVLLNFQTSKLYEFIDMFNDNSRYLDDLFTIDNPEFEKHILIYWAPK